MTNGLHTNLIQKILNIWAEEADVRGTIIYSEDEKTGERTLRIERCEIPKISIEDFFYTSEGENFTFAEFAEEIEALYVIQTELTPIWQDMLKHCNKIKSLTLQSVGLYDHNFPIWDDFENIVTLHLNFLGIFKLPDWLTKQKNLQYLDISSSRVKELPPQLMINLVALNVQQSQVKELPNIQDILGSQQKLPYLKTLLISSTEIPHIPPAYLPPQLEVLFMGERQIEKFSAPEAKAFAQLKELRILNIAGTAIKSLPPKVAFCDTLKYLDLSFTKIEKLPAWLAKTKNLTFLGLSELALEDFDSKIFDAVFKDKEVRSEDEKVIFKDNEPDWYGFPFAPTAEPGIYVIRVLIKNIDIRYLLTNDEDFLRVYYKEKKIYNHALQVVFCGKTDTENQQLIHDILSMEERTAFNDVGGWQRSEYLNLRDDNDMLLLDSDATISVWILNNEDIYRTAHHLFLGDSSLYVVLLDASQTESLYNAALTWARYIGQRSPWSRILYLLTQARDERDTHFFRQFGTINNIIKNEIHAIALRKVIDNDDDQLIYNVQVENIRKTLAGIIKEMPEYTRLIPISWKNTLSHISSIIDIHGIITGAQYQSILEIYIRDNEKYSKATVSKYINKHLREWFYETGLCFNEKSKGGNTEDTNRPLLSNIRIGTAVYNALELSQKNGGVITKSQLWESLGELDLESAILYTVQDVDTVLSILCGSGVCWEWEGSYFFPAHKNLPVKSEQEKSLVAWMDEEPLRRLYASHYMIRFDYLSNALLAAIIVEICKKYSENPDINAYLKNIAKAAAEKLFLISRESAFFSFPLTVEYGGGTLFVGGAPGINGELHICSSENQIKKDGKIFVRFKQHIKKYASLALSAIEKVCKDLPGYAEGVTYIEYVYERKGDIMVPILLNDIRALLDINRKDMYLPSVQSNENLFELKRKYIPELPESSEHSGGQ